MDDRIITDLQRRFADAERRMAKPRVGEVTATSPSLVVNLGGSTGTIADVQTLGGILVAVGDVVFVVLYGNTALVLGRVGPLESRQAYTFSNGWRNYAMTPATFADQGFFKDPAGVVHLEGVIDKNSGNWVGGETMITLPAGYRPPSARMFAVRVSSTAGTIEGMGRIDIGPSGVVVLQNGGAGNPVQWLALDGITFRAA